MTVLIGVNGFKGSGKDTVYDLACEELQGKEVYRLAFADKVKTYAMKTLGFDDDPEELLALADEFKEFGHVSASGAADSELTGREYVVQVGNEAREVFGDTFWIDQILPSPDVTVGWGNIDPRDPIYTSDFVIVTDVRYENEAARIKALGGAVWEVTRPGAESHDPVTESVLPRELVDTTIKNDGDLDELRQKVKFLLSVYS